MFFTLSKILSFLFKPITWLIFLLVFAILSKKKTKKIVTYTLILFTILSNEFIVDQVSGLWQMPVIKINQLQKKYDYGIILGGFSSYNPEDKMINFNEHGDRLISAIKLYNLGIIKKIIVSGGNGKLINNDLREAIWSYDFLINMKVNPKDILIESNSRNTIENAVYTKEIINPLSQSLLITSSLHMKRAIFCFKKNNFNFDYYATDVINFNRKKSISYILLPNAKSLEKWEDLIHEIIGYLVYQMKY